ncbi:reticulophagy regulator 3 [Thrips palmi]|uniref:Reticulophagy regulator 3 n=1 Tax=Thrips palmi TaxID=161013 RepID=A0A6P8ZV82_THRPL|nr:reticulophagy regulator 3 [Thrips palmi]
MAVLNGLLGKLLKYARGTPDQSASRPPTREENLSRALGKVEPYVVWLQSILIWENTSYTLFAYAIFNFLFWFVVSLDFRFYFLLFTTTLVVVVIEMWVDKVWPEIRVPQPAEQGDNEGWTPLHPGVLSAPELSHYLNKAMQFVHNQYLWLHSLRNEQPGMFCGLMSIGCLILMWIGRSISGTTLLYIICMSLLMIPGICIHVLPTASQVDWQSRLLGSKDNAGDDVDEYLPEQTGSNMVLLEKAVEPDHSDHEDEDDFNIPPAELLHVEDMTDSGAPSLTFISGITAMPAPEDLSLDGTDFSFEIPVTEKKASPLAHQTKRKNHTSSSMNVDTNSSDSDESISLPENENVGIHFQTRHFKRESSSEEESGPPRNKRPMEVPRKSSSGSVADAAAAVLSYSSAGALNLASLGASMGQSLISSVISSKPAQSTRSVPVKEEVEEDDSFSDTDGFEMISQDEFANL